jgi:hypothetical protein
MRRFTVTLTENNLSGPFNIYYNNDIMANLEVGGAASNIPASTLINGISILVGNDVTNISLLNLKNNCNNRITTSV